MVIKNETDQIFTNLLITYGMAHWCYQSELPRMGLPAIKKSKTFD